jgi:hypothetical protein
MTAAERGAVQEGLLHREQLKIPHPIEFKRSEAG